ncbi:adenylyltransferase/sulfurtransferase MoeZ [Flavimobilis marinus]|uniref:Adenylyltransferase and sulfurtransferase n=1 Tax=Flavimobilis marinus TaxID=285351 RepID=A0A1I2CYR1_9MICO|nr:molybdopterin-synthase adenylyltransferase MoeB [Flavimobilis marinus]GHG46591.1 adenylyltransferase/sulfurtransferase MoeZ [Flavimobilis marinus]SFE73355.1 adenylyltransferase and sulfurtransferase [Flavimobilis marinus]
MPLPPRVQPGPPLTAAQKQRYSRHLLLDGLGEEGQRRLLASRVLVVGAGGLGSPALLYLAAAGVGTIGIVDDDVVDVSNLQRQVVHATADVGRPKVDSAAERVQALNPDVVVERHRVRLTQDNARELLRGYDVVLDGTDNFPTRYLVDDTCAVLGMPLVWGSILRFDAQVAVFWSRPPGTVPGVTLRDLFPAPPPPGTTPSCGEAGVLGAMCGQVGSLMAAEAVKLLTGMGETLLGRVAVLDVLGARWSEIPLAPRPAARAAAAGTGAAAVPAPQRDVSPAPAALITAAGLARRLADREGGRDTLVVLDVREAAERTIVTIPGTAHIPLGEVLADPEAALRRVRAGDEACDVVVHCRSGQRSAQAAHALAATGASVLDLDGGVLAWVRDVDPSLPTY